MLAKTNPRIMLRVSYDGDGQGASLNSQCQRVILREDSGYCVKAKKSA